MAGAFGISANGLGEIGTDGHRGRIESGQSAVRERLARAVGKKEERVVRAGMPFHADTIESSRRSTTREQVKLLNGNSGVGENEGEHGRHVRADHRGTLA